MRVIGYEREGRRHAGAVRPDGVVPLGSEPVDLISAAWRVLAEPVQAQITQPPFDASAMDGYAVRAADIAKVPAVLRVAAARFAAERAAGSSDVPSARAMCAVYRRLVRVAYRDPVELADLAVTGNDLADAGVPPGPLVGAILRQLVDAVVEEPARNAPAWLLAEARRLADEARRAPRATA